MIILEKLVKAHFELGGKVPVEFGDMLERYAQDHGITGENAYYSLLGYRHDNQLTASERFRYRKMFYSGQTKELSKILKANSNDSLLKILKVLDVITSPMMVEKTKLGLTARTLGYARLLAHYFMHNEEKVLSHKNGTIAFKDYIRKFRRLSSAKEVKTLMESQGFKQALSVALPKFLIKPDCEPVISQGVFFLPKKLSSEEAGMVVNAAVMQIFVRALDVPEEVYYFVLKNALSYQALQDAPYLQMIDYSHMLGVSIAGLFELCGLSHVNSLRTYDETGCIIYVMGNDRYVVYAKSSVKVTDYVILSGRQIASLSESGALKTLAWDVEGKVSTPYVFLGSKVYLKELYTQRGDNDYSGGLT